MRQSGTGSRWSPGTRAAALGAVGLLVASTSLLGPASAQAIERPGIDPAAVPPDGPPGPAIAMRQTAYCAEVGVLPGTDFRVPPKFLDMLDLPEAWRFGRGGGVTVAVIDTGVSPHPRLPNLVGGGDYVMAGGDGLSDCDAHGTLVASLIAGTPATGAPLPPPRQPRKPASVPTADAPPPPPAVPAPTTVIVQVPSPEPPPPIDPEPAPSESPPPESADPLAPAPAAGPPPEPAAAQPPITAPSANFRSGPLRVEIQPVSRQLPIAPPPAAPSDAFTGVAPDVRVISIRQSSQAFGPRQPLGQTGDPRVAQDFENVRTMARAIVHAADMGANVINISQVSCMDARDVLGQADLGAAVRYAAVDKNALIVAAAGDTNQRNCKQNPVANPLRPDDPRNWDGVNTVVTPSWFDEFVLTVGAVDASGAALEKSSVAGPWVSIAAPGTDIAGFSPDDDELMNAVVGPNDSLMVPTGSGYAAAIVSGVAALVRAKYPTLSAFQVRNRLVQTARQPARGVDNRVGNGVVDPVAALTWDVPEGPVAAPDRLSAPLPLPPPAPARDMVPIYVTTVALVALLIGTVAALTGAKFARRAGRRR